MTREQKLIKRFVKIAKKLMPQIEFAMPCTPLGDAWMALYNAVKAAEKLDKTS